MTNLFNILLEAINKQLELNDPPIINQTLKRLMEEGHTEDMAKELLCENLNIELITIVREGIPENKERYMNNLLNLPTLKYDIETAFLVLPRTRWGIPFNAIEFLYYHPPCKEITDKIIFVLENAYNENIIYDDRTDCWGNFPLWYAVVAENHLSEELIEPVIELFTTSGDDWDFLNEQGQYLLVKLAEKFPDATVEKVIIAIEEQVEKSSTLPYLFLFDTLFYADLNKYKNRILAILSNPKLYWADSLANQIAHLQIKEAIPVFEKRLRDYDDELLSENYLDTDGVEIEDAIEQIKSGQIEFSEDAKPYYKDREPWKEYYKDWEDHFADEEYDDDDELEDEELVDDSYDNDENEEDYADEKAMNLHNSRHFNFSMYSSPLIKEEKVNRNDSCPCGSGKKYKKCCME